MNIQYSLPLSLIMISCVIAPNPILILNQQNQAETISPDHKLYKQYSEIVEKLKNARRSFRQVYYQSTDIEKAQIASKDVFLDKIYNIVSNKPQFIEKRQMINIATGLRQIAANISIAEDTDEAENVFMLNDRNVEAWSQNDGDVIEVCRFRINPQIPTDNNTTTKRQAIQPLKVTKLLAAIFLVAAIIYVSITHVRANAIKKTSGIKISK